MRKLRFGWVRSLADSTRKMYAQVAWCLSSRWEAGDWAGLDWGPGSSQWSPSEEQEVINLSTWAYCSFVCRFKAGRKAHTQSLVSNVNIARAQGCISVVSPRLWVLCQSWDRPLQEQMVGFLDASTWAEVIGPSTWRPDADPDLG